MGSKKIFIKQLSRNPLFKLPRYESNGAAGMDLSADIDTEVELKPLERKILPTGIAISLPKDIEAQIRPRSGLAIKHGVTLLNTPGTIDSDYRGEIKVILINISDSAYTIKPGDRVAQMVLSKYIQGQFVVVESLDDTDRGSSGFGSTGK